MANFEDTRYANQDVFSIRLTPILRKYVFTLSEEDITVGKKFKFSTYVSGLIQQDMEKKWGKKKIKTIIQGAIVNAN